MDLICPNCRKELCLVEGAIKYNQNYINYWLECINVLDEGMDGCASMFLIITDDQDNIIGIGEEIIR
jgi:hypothetical protein